MEMVLLMVRLLLDIPRMLSVGETNSDLTEDIQDLNQYRSSRLITYLIITVTVQRDLLESQKQYAK